MSLLLLFSQPATGSTLAPAAINTAEAFGQADIGATVGAASIDSREAVGAPAVITAADVALVLVGISTSEGVGAPTISLLSVVEVAGPVAGGLGGKPEKGSYWEALLSPPRIVKTEQEAEPAPPIVAPQAVVTAKPNQISIAATDASRQAMRQSVQAAAKTAQMQALAQLQQALIDQQAANDRRQMNEDDDDAIFALLLA